MRHAILLVLVPLALAGCASDPQAAAIQAASDAEAAASTPWGVEGQLAMGFIAAAGIMREAQLVRLNDAQHCASAEFEVPANATAIALAFEGELVQAEDHSAGSQYLWITPAEGEGFQLDPVLFEGVDPSAAPPRARSLEAPAAGVWTAELRATGVVLGQSWPFRVAIEGVGPTPAGLLEITCNDS